FFLPSPLRGRVALPREARRAGWGLAFPRPTKKSPTRLASLATLPTRGRVRTNIMRASVIEPVVVPTRSVDIAWAVARGIAVARSIARARGAAPAGGRNRLWQGHVDGQPCRARRSRERYAPPGRTAATPARKATGVRMPRFEQLIDGDPWQVSEADWPAAGTAADKLALLLNYAMLAPSILNAQPWRFTLADGRLDLHEDAARRMAVVDPEGRESTISCGAALANLVIAARSFGEDPQVDVLPAAEPGAPLAVLRLGPRRDAADADKRLREAMKRRRTCRFDFDPAPLDAGVIDALAERARSDGATLT